VNSFVDACIQALSLVGLGFLKPVVAIFRGEDPRAHMRQLWLDLGAPLVAITAFLLVWSQVSAGIQTSLGQIPGPAAVWQQTKALRDKYSRPGYGFGLDMNGFGEWPAPVGASAPNAVTYPFRTFDGGSLVDRQVAGQRTFDINTDGLAEYGLLPDYVEQIRRSPGGQAVVDDLAKGAASYLKTWAATVAY
jgi:hypothetical protein